MSTDAGNTGAGAPAQAGGTTDAGQAAPAQGQQQGAGFQQDGGQGQQAAPEFTPEQQTALQKVDALRAEFLAAKGDSDKQDAILKQISERQRFAFGLSSVNPDTPKAPTQHGNEEADGLADSLRAAVSEPMSPADREFLQRDATVKGLDANIATDALGLTDALGMSTDIARSIMGRVQAHYGMNGGENPETAFQPLSPEATQDYIHHAGKLCGGVDKLIALSNQVREALGPEAIKILDEHNLTKCSLAFDPFVLRALLLHAQVKNRTR